MPRNTSSSMFTALFEELSNMNASQLDAILTEAHRVAATVFAAESGLTPEEMDMIGQRDLISCVKSIRNRTGLGLAECKKIMDRAR